MNEETLLASIEEALRGIKSDKNNSKSAPLFKRIIANQVPIWTSVDLTPAVCFYLPETEYEEGDGLRTIGNATVLFYVYNKHKTKGLSLTDILTPYINAIKAEVKGLPDKEATILNAYVTKVKRDGGTVLPYTIAEIEVSISFIERITCP